MLITFRNTHYKKKKKKPLISLPFDSISCPYKLFSALPHQPLSLISSFQPQSANPITSKKKKKKTYFLLSSHFSLLKTFIWDNFFRHKTVVFAFPSITPNFGAQMGQLILFYCYSYIFFTLRNLH